MSTTTRTLLMLYALGLVYHGLWALTIPTPAIWDSQYYTLVARQIAEGQGAVTEGLFTLTFLPDTLPLPADLHWSPLPSRILVPGVWLWPAHGAQLVTVLLAAFWGPLAYAIAQALALSSRSALVAGLLAASGGFWVQLASTPDCYALYGTIGGALVWAIATERVTLAVCMGIAASLARNDGALLPLCLAFGLTGRGRWLVAASGIVTTALWGLRNYMVAGRAYLDARAISTNTNAYPDVFNGILTDPLSALDRLRAPLDHSLHLWQYLLAPGIVLLVPCMLYAAWVHRDQRWVRAVAAAFAVMAFMPMFLAPQLAIHGTLYRSGVALWPVQAVFAVVGIERTVAWTVRAWSVPAFIPRLVLFGGFVALSLFVGKRRAEAVDLPDVCTPVADLPQSTRIFTHEPLLMELACRRPGIFWTKTTPPERVRMVAQRYGVTHALTDASKCETSGGVCGDMVRSTYPSWGRDGGDERFTVEP